MYSVLGVAGPIQAAGEPPVLAAQPPQAAGAVAQGALRGGREAEGEAARGSRQIPSAAQVPFTEVGISHDGLHVLFSGCLDLLKPDLNLPP